MSDDGALVDHHDRRARRVVGIRLTAAVLALAGLAWWGTSDATLGEAPRTTDTASLTQAPTDADALVRSASLGCPGTVQTPSAVAVATAPGLLRPSPDAQTEGAGALRPIGEDEQSAGAERPLDPVGGSARLRVQAGQGAQATGSGAAGPGLVAGQLTIGAEPGLRGLSLSACAEPTEVQWLLAGGDAPGRVEELILTNPGSDPLQVDVAILDVDGRVEVTGGTDVVVPAHSRVVRRLDALAPGVAAPAVEVRSTGGPVTAHLAERYRDGTVDLGADITSSAAAPARELLIPALPPASEHPAGDSQVSLRLLAPETQAVVEVQWLTESGSATPDTPVVRVPAGASIDVLLDPPEGAAALRLRSDQPVTGAVLLRVAPGSDAPVDPDEAGDDAAATTAPSGDQAAATTEPPGEDAVATSAAPGDDTAETTGGSGGEGSAEPVVHPAGDLTWLPALALQASPSGLALPDTADVPEAGLRLAVSAVDATVAEVVWLDGSGAVDERSVDLANDTTAVLDVPGDAVAVWVHADTAGVAAAVHLSGADELGPYLGAAPLTATPWTRDVTRIDRVVP